MDLAIDQRRQLRQGILVSLLPCRSSQEATGYEIFQCGFSLAADRTVRVWKLAGRASTS